MSGPIDIKQKGFVPGIDDHDGDLLVTKVMSKDLPDSNQGDFSYRRAVNSSGFLPCLSEIRALMPETGIAGMYK